MLIKVEKTINKMSDYVGCIAAVLLMLLVLIISYNVMGRYLFPWLASFGLPYITVPAVALQELAWHLYSAVFLLGISYALKTGNHVRVDIIYENLSLKTRTIIDLVGTSLFLIPLCLIVIYSGWEFTKSAFTVYGNVPEGFSGAFTQLVTEGIGEKTQDPGGLLNRFIIKGVIPLSFLLLLLNAISFLIHKINLLTGAAEENEMDRSTH